MKSASDHRKAKNCSYSWIEWRNRTTPNGEVYLHSNKSIIHQHFLCQEIGPNSRLIASAELLVDLYNYQPCLSCTPTFLLAHQSQTEGWMPYILVHQTRLSNPTVSQNDHLLCALSVSKPPKRKYHEHTFSKTFFLEAIFPRSTTKAEGEATRTRTMRDQCWCFGGRDEKRATVLV